MAKMTEDDLLSLLEAEQADAFHYNDGDVSRARNQAMRDYLRFPYGTEQDGRSQVVSSDVFETIEGILPDLVEVFVSSDKAVVFDPVGAEDEAGAKQATDACNHVFYKQNNGFLILYTAAKDALMMRTGGVKWYWEVKRTPAFETLVGDEMQIALHLVTHPDAVVISHEEVEHEFSPEENMQRAAALMMGAEIPEPPKRYKIRTKTIKERGQVRVVSIPAYELEVAARHNSILLDECPYVAHKSQKTLSDIHELGFKNVTEDDVKAAANESETQDQEFYETIRGEDPTHNALDLDPAMSRGWLREEYVLCDRDGDGVAERLRVLRLGKKILEAEECSQVQIAAWTPYILTHKFDGLSVADLTTDIQRITTEILRAQLDNLALANNQETVVLTDTQGNPKANIDDLLNRRPGGVLREQAAGAIRPYVERWQGIEAMPMVEMVGQMKEKRTGYSPVVAGLDADALNKTATEVSKQTNERQKRMKLMARIMAEALVKPMFLGIFKTLTDYCMEKLSFRLNGQFVQYDPQEWRDGYDMTVNVGIGSGDTLQQTMFLQQIAQSQAVALQSPIGYKLVNPEKIYNVQARLAEMAGFKNPTEFWLDPKTIPDQPPQPPLELQIKQAELAADQQRFAAETQRDTQIEVVKSQAAATQRDLELQNQAANDLRDAEREAMSDQRAHELKVLEIGSREQLEREKLAVQQYGIDQNNRTKIIVARMGGKGSADGEETEVPGVQGESYVDPMTQVADSMRALAESMARPKQVVRDADGKVIGVQ